MQKADEDGGRSLGVGTFAGSTKWTVAGSHTIVLEPGLGIFKIYNGYWFFGRPTLEELRAVTRKCRPDWDITSTELRAAWEQGHKELFYPYGKTFAATLGED